MITAVVGGQYGSEGKGKVCQLLAPQYDVFVRVGGPNAGHVIYDGTIKYIMRSLPTGWINRHAKLVIGAGAILNPTVLLEEIANIALHADPNIHERIYIDHRATIIESWHLEAEKGIKETLGSTGQGVGTARSTKVQRKAKRAHEEPSLSRYIADTVELLHIWKHDLNILLEGTQGFMLSNTFGNYPYTTSNDVTTSQLLNDVGLSPKDLTNTIGVFRAYPIRVGGNSGPLERETGYDILNQPEEYTSVTKKVRRIGHFNYEQLRYMKNIVGVDQVAITFLDYYTPADGFVSEYEALSARSKRFVNTICKELGAPPIILSTGVHSQIMMEDYNAYVGQTTKC